MRIEILAPTPGESIAEVEVTTWLVQNGDLVQKNQDLAEIESDKATLTVTATEAGKLQILQEAGQTVKVGTPICSIDTDAAGSIAASPATKAENKEAAPPKVSAPAQAAPEAPAGGDHGAVKVSPLAQKMMEVEGVSLNAVLAGLSRITTKEVRAAQTANVHGAAPDTVASSRGTSRQKISQLRKKLSQRLVAVKNETAMLTTFNEVDMSAVMQLREKYQKDFVAAHGVKLGLMSFFIKASALAMHKHPMVNSMIDGEEIVTPDYVDIAVAVQTPKGLMVPVIRNAAVLSLAQIEQKLQELATRAREGKIGLDEMTGGTFTITNGGVFGSMLSTPILNPPQSAILGMHNITDRPVAIQGRVEVRPVMYVALSYDHRIIDGKDSVGFLVEVKKSLENPYRLLTGGQDADRKLLEI